MVKILELTNYTAGGCGVGGRVLIEAEQLAKMGHKIEIFSTNREKGTNRTCPAHEIKNKITIKRFPSVKLGGESYMYWSFEQAARVFGPDIIIAHAYRHIHTILALRVARSLNCPIILVTHAPFDRDNTRTKLQRTIVSLYDKSIGKKIINSFSKVMYISKWEIPYLLELGAKNKNLKYSPNGLKEIFFKKTTQKSLPHSIVYTGRIAPIKNIDLLLIALSKIKSPISFTAFGPVEESYENHLNNLISKFNLTNVKIINSVYNPYEQIRELDRHAIFILPSKSEGQPQVLLEAMARGKIVIASNNQGNKDIILHRKNGYLFDSENANALANMIKLVLNLTKKEKASISSEARKTAKNFRWKFLILQLEKTILNLVYKRNIKRQNNLNSWTEKKK